MTHSRKLLLTILIVLLFAIGIITSFYFYLIGFDPKAFLASLHVGLLGKIGIILALYIFRNYLFIPSTVIIILSGVILQDFLLTAVVSIIGVGIGIAETYAIGYLFREDITGDSKKLPIIGKYRKQIQENGVKIVFFSCMFPLTPVDLLYYAAGFIKYRFIPFFIAAIMGEMWLILLYAYFGVEARKYVSFAVYFIGIFLVVFVGWWVWKRRGKI
ncbi:MAG: VTT domain-containing protein [Candidatus Gracilibacteria bacterium]|nr:VTT domain-containing protein [Candidatus Gracilibacteria bacterium]